MLGTRIQSVAIGWEMYGRTGEALSLGYIGLAQTLPPCCWPSPRAISLHRFNRPKLVMISLAAMTVTSLGLAVLSFTRASVNAMYLLLFLDAAAVMIGMPRALALGPAIGAGAGLPQCRDLEHQPDADCRRRVRPSAALSCRQPAARLCDYGLQLAAFHLFVVAAELDSRDHTHRRRLLSDIGSRGQIRLEDTRGFSP